MGLNNMYYNITITLSDYYMTGNRSFKEKAKSLYNNYKLAGGKKTIRQLED